MELLQNVIHRTMRAIEMQFKKKKETKEKKDLFKGFFCITDSCFQEQFPAHKIYGERRAEGRKEKRKFSHKVEHQFHRCYSSDKVPEALKHLPGNGPEARNEEQKSRLHCQGPAHPHSLRILLILQSLKRKSDPCEISQSCSSQSFQSSCVVMGL